MMDKDKAIKEIGNTLQNMTWGETSVKAITNIPSSAYNFAKDIATPIMHPIETAKGLGQVAAGGVQKLIPGQQGNEQSFDAVIDFFKNRYGSIDSLKNTIATDPVGFLGDLSSVFSGAGSVVKNINKVSKIADAAKIEQIANVGAKVGQAIDPLSISAKGVSLAAKTMPKAIPERIYQSAAKFSTVAGKGKKGITSQDVRSKLVRTALENEIMPTVSGVQKIFDTIQSIGNKIEGLVDASGNVSRKMPVDEIFKYFNELEQDTLRYSGKPMSQLEEINSIRQEIIEANNKLQRGELTPKEAQKFKQTIYSDIEKYYKKTAGNPASIKAQKAMARAAKDYLEEIIPEIKMLNRRDGDLIELLDYVDRSASRIRNRDFLGIGLPIKIGTGAAVGSAVGSASMGGALGLIQGILDTPSVKSKLAIVLDKIKRKGIKIKQTDKAIELGLFQVGRLENQSE